MKKQDSKCGIKQMPEVRVCGIRDGLRFSFATQGALHLEKQTEQAFEMVEEKTAALAELLAEGGIVEIAGLVFGEAERLQLEQRLRARFGNEIEVRKGKSKSNAPLSVVHHGTVRGGMCLRSGGDITVVGDVHAGARLEANGHITVLGKLLGAAWAGCGGREDAIVSAWQLSPSEIRIASVIAQKSGVCYQEKPYPETAFLSEGAICVRKYNVKDRI